MSMAVLKNEDSCDRWGGIRGLYACQVLMRIQNDLNVNLYRDFDLVVGTSTGAIIAAALAYNIPLDQIARLYQEKGSVIFKRRKWSLGGFLFPRYSSAPLKSVLNDLFREATLSETQSRLLIPATEISSGKMHIFRSSYHSNYARDRNVKISDALLASCSAPLYFSPTRIDAYLLSDGGLWANNPSLLAINEAITNLGAERQQIRLLSIGTGRNPSFNQKTYSHSHVKKSWNLSGLELLKLVPMLLNLHELTILNATQLLLDKHQFVRINFDSAPHLTFDNLDAIQVLIKKADTDFKEYYPAICQLLTEKPHNLH